MINQLRFVKVICQNPEYLIPKKKCNIRLIIAKLAIIEIGLIYME